MKEDFIIIGAGSVGKHIAVNFKQYFSEANLLGFLDDNQDFYGKCFFGIKVLGKMVDISQFPTDINIIVAIAFPKLKYQLIESIKKQGFSKFPSAISSSAWVSSNVSIGEGVLIYPNVAINYGSLIGDFVTINMNCSIGHNSTIKEYSSLAPGVCLAGHTSIGEGVEVGISACTIQQIEVGSHSVIAAGSVLIHSVPQGDKVAGNPAKSILQKC